MNTTQAVKSKNGESFLLDQFREFLAELVMLKDKAAHGEWAFSDEPPPFSENAAADGANAVSNRLQRLFERQAVEAARRGGVYGQALHRDAQYAMAALADEAFLHMLDWSGKHAWKDNLLETRLFKSHIAGEKLFEEIERLLAGRDPMHAELAAIYMLVLAAGFRGRYRDGDDDGKLARYRQQLFHFVGRRSPDLSDHARPLFPEAHAGTLDEGTARKLPHLRPWLTALAGFWGVFLIVSFLLWGHLAAGLENVLRPPS